MLTAREPRNKSTIMHWVKERDVHMNSISILPCTCTIVYPISSEARMTGAGIATHSVPAGGIIMTAI